jgi:hypothetical protein
VRHEFSDPNPDRCRLSRILIVLGTATATLLLLVGVALDTIHCTPTALRFFDPRRPPTFEEAWFVSTMDYALSSSEKNDVVFLGDSTCRTAVDPVRFESLTGLRAYNLGVIGDLGPEVRLDLARAYLSKHPVPRLMVLCISPLGMERDVPFQWQMLRDRCVDCYGFEQRNLGSLESRLSYVIRQGALIAWQGAISPLVGRHGDIRDRAFIGTEKENYRKFENSTRLTRGFTALSGKKYEARVHHSAEIVSVHDVWNTGVRNLAETCAKAGAPLMIRFAPMSAEGTKTLDFRRIERWVEDARRSCPNVIVTAENGILRYPSELFWDGTHPNADGAAKFTARVAEEVRSSLDPGHASKTK